MTDHGRASIAPIDPFHRGMRALRDVASAEGCRFLKRMVGEWREGTNRLNAPGERWIGTFMPASAVGMLVGVCGLNRDPYANDDAVARLRQLYVLPEWR